jgi:uncharacterized membrane protein YvlD (DUF360 family)
MPVELDSSGARRLIPLITAASAALIYLLLGVLSMAFGHPDEDAYILFIYSEIFADTGRIGFFADGPPIEGATDFLWMVILAALDKLGIPTAYGAQLLNALGVFIISYVIASQSCKTRVALLVLAGLALLVPFMRFVHAGFVGFSAPLYSALVLVIFVMVWRAPSARLILVPWLCILLGLFRPDGVIIGVLMTLSGFVIADRQHRPKYLMACGGAVVIGVVYFIWRYTYFNAFLPLPLYVKSSLEGVPSGLASTMTWLGLSVGYLVCAALFAFVSRKDWRRLALATLPIVLFLSALSVSHLSQNINFRFQAPVGVVLYVLTASFFAAGLSSASFRIGRVAMIGLGATAFLYSLAGDLVGWKNRIIGQFYYSYMDTFPMYVSDMLSSEMTLVVTEAGRFPYWTPGRTYDLVGLNTPQVAREGATPEMLAGMTPDLIFVHSDYLIEFDCPARTFCPVAPDVMKQAIQDANLPPSGEEANRAIRAAKAYFEYMAENAGRYHTFSVHFVRGFPHLYSIARDSEIDPERFAEGLAASFANPRRWSYMEGLSVIDRADRH